MKRVSTVEELVEAVDELRKLGVIGVQIIPQKGAALLPRDDFMPSAKAENSRSDLKRELNPKVGRMTLGGKFSLYLDLGTIIRTDRAILVPIELCNKTIELYQETTMGLPKNTGKPKNIELSFWWGGSEFSRNCSKKVYSLRQLNILENILNVEEKWSDEITDHFSKKMGCRLNISRHIHFTIFDDPSIEYSAKPKDGLAIFNGYYPCAMDKNAPYIVKGQKLNHSPFEVRFYRDFAEVVESLEFEYELKERHTSSGLSYDEMAANGMGVDELPPNSGYTVHDIAVKKCVMGDPRKVTQDEAMSFVKRLTNHDVYIPKAYERGWAMVSQAEVDAYNQKASELCKNAIEAKKTELLKRIEAHGLAAEGDGGYMMDEVDITDELVRRAM